MIERPLPPKALRQIWVGDEEAPERDHIGALLDPGHTNAVDGRVGALHRGIFAWSAGKPLLATLAPPVGSKLR